MTTKPNKRGDRESISKRIKNNDSKDDPKSWKQSGSTYICIYIYRLEIRIEKMEEMFNKDLEEVKQSQSIVNDAILTSKALWREPTVE